MPQHELLACAQCGCFAFSCFEDFAIRVNFPVKSPYGSPRSVKLLIPPTCLAGEARCESGRRNKWSMLFHGIRRRITEIQRGTNRGVRSTGRPCFGHPPNFYRLARGFTDMWDGFLLGKRYLIHDRDPLFTKAVRGLLRDSGVKQPWPRFWAFRVASLPPPDGPVSVRSPL